MSINSIIKKTTDTFRHTYTFWTALIIIVTVKLYSIRYSEIVAESTDPANYLMRAYHNIWSKEIGFLNLGHPPGYSIFVWFCSFLGLPLRICHEFFYLGSLIILIYAIKRLNIPKLVCICLFFIMAFYPLTFTFFNHARSEAITIGLFNLLTAMIIFLVNNPKESTLRYFSIIFGLILAAFMITRPEKLIIYVYILGLFIASIILGKVKLKNRYFGKQITYYLILPLLIVLLTKYFVTRLGNFKNVIYVIYFL